jgi:N-alpha-acetyltransferase 30
MDTKVSTSPEEGKIELSPARPEDIKYRQFVPSDGIETLIRMIETELSEPYSIFLYRHFINDFPELTIVATYEEKIIGCIIGKLEDKNGNDGRDRGYIAMLAVLKEFRNKGIGRCLVHEFNMKVKELGVFTVILETECCNKGALRLYEGKFIISLHTNLH